MRAGRAGPRVLAATRRLSGGVDGGGGGGAQREIESKSRGCLGGGGVVVVVGDGDGMEVLRQWRVQNWRRSGTRGVPRFVVGGIIGREEGTWMDPRWGASGRRIEFSLDIALSSVQASNQIVSAMVQDNQKGQSSPTYSVETASKARLNRGFDSMKVYPGGFRVDQTKNCGTMRFFVSVEGTKKGDVSIPKGYLYFSLPCFGGITSIEKIILSTKDGIVSVRQVGWHTGWRRIESRIVGTFRAVPIEKARQMNGY